MQAPLHQTELHEQPKPGGVIDGIATTLHVVHAILVSQSDDIVLGFGQAGQPSVRVYGPGEIQGVLLGDQTLVEDLLQAVAQEDEAGIVVGDLVVVVVHF